MGSIYSLQELVSPEWYNRNGSPVYWQGGPLVHYLCPEVFFELYSAARPETFLQDCEEIPGDSWQEVEEGFWPWY